jgi:hypothetical protein
MLPQVYEAVEPGTGREWMVILSIIIPALLLLVLIYLGTKRTV